MPLFFRGTCHFSLTSDRKGLTSVNNMEASMEQEKHKIKLIDKEGVTTKLTPAIFNRYKSIYQKHLIGNSTAELVEKLGMCRQTIAKAIKYMAGYCDYKFENNQEIQIAIDKVRLRKQKLNDISAKAEKSKNYGVAVRVQQELRKNDELEFKLKGILKVKFEADIGGQVVIMHNMGQLAPTERAPEMKTVEVKGDVE